MSKIEEYQTLQMQIYMLAQLVANLPLEDHVSAQQRSRDVGAIFAPSAWIANNEKLEQDYKIAGALLDFQRAVRRLGVFDTGEQTDSD